MDIGSSSIPAEIVCEVVSYLTKVDIKHFRLVSKGFSAFGSQSLFESIYISPRSKDREAFRAVSKHPVLSRVVREVVFDSTYITIPGEEELLPVNKANYTRFLLGDHGGHMSPGGTRSAKYTKAAIHRGFESFIQSHKEQERLAEYNDIDLTHELDRATRPDNFHWLLMDRKRHSEILQYLPNDLVCLVVGLPHMPGVKHFVISDNHYSQYSSSTQACQVLSLTVKNQGIPGIDEIIIDPRPWPRMTEEDLPADCNRSWFRGFTVLMQAASMIKMKTLESFIVTRNCGMGGLSHVMLQMSAPQLYHTKNAFGNVKDIQLKISTRSLDEMYWQETVEYGGLAQILGAATHLEKLDLSLDLMIADDDDAISFGALISNHKWPKLHSITLSEMILKSDECGFLDFFNRHRRSLHTMRLKNVLIGSNDDAVGLTPGNWGNTFFGMASGELNLTNMTLENSLSKYSREAYFHSCEASKVYQFLLAGGNIQWNFEPRCVHMTHSFWDPECSC